VTVIGIAATAWDLESLGTLKVGDRLSTGAYEVRLERVVPRQEANFREDVVTLRVFRNGHELGTVDTMKRLYLTRGMPTTEAGIMTVGLSQLYASVGEILPDGSIGLTVYHKPLVLLIWLGSIVMAAGGALSLTDRRLRIAAPAPARTMPIASVPAE
jgi:cytochrome c-type biogenesis protein CcmF